MPISSKGPYKRKAGGWEWEKKCKGLIKRRHYCANFEDEERSHELKNVGGL
jgi:hypothetical protein